MDELERRIAAGPGYFPHQLDLAADRLLLVETNAAELAAASFLDQRLLKPDTKGSWVAMGQLLARAAHAPRDDAHYIFHTGHVGSTLVSRLLGQVAGVLALREPLALRTIAEVRAKEGAVDMPWAPEQVGPRIALLRRLLARTFEPSQRAIVKATSFTSEVAADLVAPEARAVFLYVTPQSYMQTILAGEASRQELAMLTGPRLVRLARRMPDLPFRLWTLSEGERVALGWATEMLSLAEAARALPERTVLWVDFDDFLARPAEQLARIAAHFGLALQPGEAERLAGDKLMTRYSKAPEHDYSPQLRRQLLDQAAAQHREALAAGMAWLDRLSADHAGLTQIRAERG